MKSAICKRLFGSAVVIASLAVCAKAGATSYWDLDAYAGSAGYVDPTHSVTGIFDITGAGPGGGFTGSNSGGTEIVDSAIFEFTILDDQMKEPETESWQIDIGDEADLASGASKYLFNLVFSFGTASILADIQADGRVSYEVSSNGGDFYLLNAFMGVETVSSQQVPGSRVPDGGLTLALLGGAVLGMGTLFRRR